MCWRPPLPALCHAIGMGNMLPEVEEQTGALPSGRYRVDPETFRARFGTSNARREELWTHWETATGILRSHVPVCAAWIGGSYLTSKPDPGDIDCVYLIDSAVMANASEEASRILWAFASGNIVKDHLGLELDTFVLQWEASATPLRSNPEVRSYHETRGYWDDLWSKMRSGPRGSSPTRVDSHPRRGYVEVILDGYSQTGPFRTD